MKEEYLRSTGLGSDLSHSSTGLVAYSEEMADGALEMVETAYGTISCYHAGWAAIHPQDQEDWLATFAFLKEPLDALGAWARASQLSTAQARRFAALQKLMAQLDPVLAELDGSGRLFPGRALRRTRDDGFDLL